MALTVTACAHSTSRSPVPPLDRAQQLAAGQIDHARAQALLLRAENHEVVRPQPQAMVQAVGQGEVLRALQVGLTRQRRNPIRLEQCEAVRLPQGGTDPLHLPGCERACPIDEADGQHVPGKHRFSQPKRESKQDHDRDRGYAADVYSVSSPPLMVPGSRV